MVGVIRATFADRNAKRINDNLYKEEKIRRLQRFYHPKCPRRLKIQSRTPAGYDIQKKKRVAFLQLSDFQVVSPGIEPGTQGFSVLC